MISISQIDEAEIERATFILANRRATITLRVWYHEALLILNELSSIVFYPQQSFQTLQLNKVGGWKVTGCFFFFLFRKSPKMHQKVPKLWSLPIKLDI